MIEKNMYFSYHCSKMMKSSLNHWSVFLWSNITLCKRKYSMISSEMTPNAYPSSVNKTENSFKDALQKAEIF